MIKINQSVLQGTIDAIPSKSFAHRALILASLCNSPTRIYGKGTGVDVQATVQMLRSLGADIKTLNDGFEISPIRKATTCPVINVKESGSSLRFLLPIVSVLGIDCEIVGEGRLASRPNKELIDALREGGAYFDNDTLPLKFSGKFDANRVIIRADISSQFVSGMLMAMQTLPHKSELCLSGTLKSKKYVDITLECMRSFGAVVQETNEGYILSGGGYKSPECFSVEGDWSNAAFWLVAGAVGGDITVNNLNFNSYQGDKAILDILKVANADMTISESSVRVKKAPLSAFSYDFEDIPDLVPICAVLASFAKGKSEFFSVDRLRLKESDRIESTLDMLSQSGIEAYFDKQLYVQGGQHSSGVIKGYNDHRIVMSGCIIGANTKLGAYVTEESAVNKSYSDFFKDFEYLGGSINA